MKLFDRLRGHPDRDDFAAIVIDAFRRAGTTEPIEYDPKGFKLLIGGDIQAFLANIYSDYLKAQRNNREEMLKRFVAGAVGAGTGKLTLEEALPNLIPIVRTLSFHHIVNLQLQVDGKDPEPTPMLPLGGHLALSLVVDAPDAMSYVTQDRLGAWGIPMGDAMNRALENLLRCSAPKFERRGAGVYVSAWHDAYDSSRLCFPQMFSDLEVSGDHVAVVPNRDTLIVTGSNDSAGMAVVADICEKAQGVSRPTSCIPVILRGTTWESYLPGPDSPEHELFNKLRIIEQSRDYAEQKALLEKWHQATHQDIFVASYKGTRHRESGRYGSYCVWSDGVLTLLPEADTVMFFQQDKDTGENRSTPAAWSRVREVLDSLMEPLDVYPRRFRVERFPSPEQLAKVMESPTERFSVN
ncbi:MAG TPA: hypothetical protein VI756_08925 [Blastocatellia bacterium]